MCLHFHWWNFQLWNLRGNEAYQPPLEGCVGNAMRSFEARSGEFPYRSPHPKALPALQASLGLAQTGTHSANW